MENKIDLNFLVQIHHHQYSFFYLFFWVKFLSQYHLLNLI